MSRALSQCCRYPKTTSLLLLSLQQKFTQHPQPRSISNLFDERKRHCFLQLSSFHTHSLNQAGHNKWSKIKRKKAIADMARSRFTNKYVERITSAIRTGGSTNPEKNLRLASVIDQAKSAGVPKSNVESAIERANTRESGSNAESLMFDGRGVNGYLLLIEALTDNIKRTKPQVRTILEKNGATLGDPGSATFNFEHKALVRVPISLIKPQTDPLELAIEIGAEDVSTLSGNSDDSDITGQDDLDADKQTRDCEEIDGEYQFKCDVGDLREVIKSLREKGIEEFSTHFDYLPKTVVELSAADYEKANKIVDLLCEHEEVVDVYCSFVLKESELNE